MGIVRLVVTVQRAVDLIDIHIGIGTDLGRIGITQTSFGATILIKEVCREHSGLIHSK